MFILGAQRNLNVTESFRRYEEYLQINSERFPKSAYTLAISDWYWNPEVSGCPHDAWLERLTIAEPSSGKRNETRTAEMSIELLAPYHDGIIQLRYPRVFGYKFDSLALNRGHGDWLFDEFRLDEQGRLVHEIEWQYLSTWIITASDVEYKWSPFEAGTPPTNRPRR